LDQRKNKDLSEHIHKNGRLNTCINFYSFSKIHQVRGFITQPRTLRGKTQRTHFSPYSAISFPPPPPPLPSKEIFKERNKPLKIRRIDKETTATLLRRQKANRQVIKSLFKKSRS
jgi:hypothetical protein